MLLRCAIATSLVFGFATGAVAQQVVKHEPPIRGMRTNEVLLVDDGKCPKGQIKRVTAGMAVGGGGRAGGNPTLQNTGATGRIRQCIPRPPGV
jgi:hypothetical protein